MHSISSPTICQASLILTNRKAHFVKNFHLSLLSPLNSLGDGWWSSFKTHWSMNISNESMFLRCWDNALVYIFTTYRYYLILFYMAILKRRIFSIRKFTAYNNSYNLLGPHRCDWNINFFRVHIHWMDLIFAPVKYLSYSWSIFNHSLQLLRASLSSCFYIDYRCYEVTLNNVLCQ